MAHTPPLTEADVRALASEQSFDRGYRYYRSRSVLDITRRGNLITAKVEGSEYEPYRIEVRVNDAGIVELSCTCPYDWGGICKHLVATLLVVVHQPETIAEKTTLTTLLADLTAEQLRQVLIDIAEIGPDFAEVIEQEVTWLRDQLAAPAGISSTLVNLATIRREIHKDFRLAGKGDPFRDGYYDEYAGLEVDPDGILPPHLEILTALLDGSDVATAVKLITTIIEAFIDGLTDLDEWVYEYNMDVFDEANLTLGAALAEVLLSLDMQPEQQEEWLAQIADWEGVLGDLAINMMAQSGDIEKAIAEAKDYLVYPREIRSLAQVLVTKGALDEALNVAEHGLSLRQSHGKDDLARWARDQATAVNNQQLALKAAQVAFTSSYELVDYTAVQQLAGDEWQTIKPELLQKLQQSWSATDKIDIFLHENMHAEAMQVVDENGFVTDYDLHRVIEVTRETHPDWGIRKCKEKAEGIMDAGQSGAYDTAVSWLCTARDIYQQHQREREWEIYLEHLLSTHHRKYKLVPMLRDIRL